MSIRSANGFYFSSSTTAEGDVITVVAEKDDHENKRTEVFRMNPEEAMKLAELIRVTCQAAKQRRKAIRRAAIAALNADPIEGQMLKVMQDTLTELQKIV